MADEEDEVHSSDQEEGAAPLPKKKGGAKRKLEVTDDKFAVRDYLQDDIKKVAIGMIQIDEELEHEQVCSVSHPLSTGAQLCHSRTD